MADGHDYLALDWVQGEIQETLTQAQQALEAWVENPEDSTRMRFCQTYLHQVFGTLQMVEFYGASLLAEEMEKLSQALLNGEVASQQLDGARETLMRAILQLPSYLEGVQASRRDLPVVLLPLLNDMRAARGESLLSETSLFKPDLEGGTPGGQVPPPVKDDPEFPQLARKIRQMYQLALLGVLRDQDMERNLGFMEKVFTRLEQVSGEAAMSRLWQSANALVEAISRNAVESGTSVKMLLGQLDRVMKQVVVGGAGILTETPPRDLLKNLLFYVAKSGAHSPRIDLVRELFRLDEALPDEAMVDAERSRMTGPDQSAMTSVSEALSEELDKVKLALEQLVQDGRAEPGALDEQCTVLKQVADTVAVLGLNEPRKAVEEQLAVLQDMAAGKREIDHDALMDVAGALLYVEATLAGVGAGERSGGGGQQAGVPAHLEHARDAVTRESLAGLEEAKDGIVEFIASQWNHSFLEPVPEKLDAVRGGLQMVYLDRPALILRQAVRYIREQLLAEGAENPDWRSMDTLADAITGVEYYLERLADDPQTLDHVLDLARESVATLGYPLGDKEFGRTADGDDVSSTAPPEPIATEEPGVPEESADAESSGSTEPAEQAEPSLDELSLEEPSLEESDTGTEEPASSADELEVTAEEQQSEAPSAQEPDFEDLETPGEAEPAPEQEPKPEPEPAASAEQPSGEEAAGDDLIDDEIIEIFVEEVGEVLEALNEHFPRWAANQDDEESLVEFRRAFHTLKGSGRMVGASTVGELAWSIENMLNRVIDKTISASPELVELVRRVHGLIPALVDAFSRQQPPPVDVSALEEAAFHLAEGGRLEAVPDVGDPGKPDGLDLPEPDLPPPVVEPGEGEPAQAPSGSGDGEEEASSAGEADWLSQEAGGADVDDGTDLDIEEIEYETPGDDAAADEAVSPEEAATAGEGAAADGVEIDPVLLDIFRNEGQTNLALVDDWLAGLDPEISEHPVDDSVHRALHTLKGSARMAEMWHVATVAEPAEKFVKELVNHNYPADRDAINLFHDVVATLRPGVDNPDPREQSLPGSEALLERIAAAHEQLGRREGASDQHILSVFLSEGMDLIMDAESLLDRWASHPENVEELVRLRDELSILSGSAETAGLTEVNRLSGAMVDCYTAVEEGRLHCSDGFLELMHQAHEGLMNMMDNLAAAQSVQPEDELVDALRRLLEDGTPPAGPGSGSGGEAGESSPAPEAPAGQGAPGPPQADAGPDSGAGDADARAAPVVEPSELDPDLLDIFLEEAEEILENAGETLEAWQQDGDTETVAGLQRDLHTLKGGARMAGAVPIGDLAHTLEDLYEGATGGQLEPDDNLFELLHRCHDRLAEMVEALRGGQAVQAAPELVSAIEGFLRGEPAASPAPGAGPPSSPEPAPPAGDEAPANTAADAPAASAAVTEEAPAAPPPPPERDPELAAIFLEEAEEILENVGARLDAWMEDPDNLVEVQSLQRDLHTLKGGARMAEVKELGDLAHELEDLYEGLAQSTLSAKPELFELLHRCHDVLAEMVEAVRDEQGIYPADELIRTIQAYGRDPDGFSASDIPAPAPVRAAVPAAGGEAAEESPAPAAEPPAEPARAEPESEPHGEAPSSQEPVETLSDDVDTEILDIFLEESSELTELIEQSIGAWKETPDSTRHLDELKRALHTLKGGARLSGLNRLGELSHDFEEFLTEARENRVPVDDAFFDQLVQWQDRIADMMEQVRNLVGRAGSAPAAAAAPAEAPQPETGQEVATQAERQEENRQAVREKRQQTQPQEMVRVASDLLESLVNLAGETSINRARVEQGISEFTLHVEEMGHTIERLYEQLRRLDVETEAQIMSKYKQDLEAGEVDEDFDPLEMDQYSELHQITKQLSESASDLLDLKGTLIDKTKDTETLLLQQSRVNTELQEKLMRTRMVPFARLVPRLRRIVRQVSGELGKRVNFDVVNAEGELDRTLMERVVAPLEHMLRNAVDHGIEDQEGRKAAGKDEQGNITLALTREGGEVVLTLSDDGKGIDADAVRRKAIERGLIDADAELTDQEIQQFIFSAGFSTAAAVTQVSGRGVGMDVVASEIKQMGGSVAIESTKGQGTRFIVHLPFTLAMNRALMVKVGEDTYAIPLDQIEGIVRVSPYELDTFFEPDAPDFVYAGQHYGLEYLGNYVHGSFKPNLDNQIMPMPVLLVRSTEHEAALLVDALVGSREVVVKSVGPQLSTVAGISGATILGDGSVVIILDIHSLIRASHVQQQHTQVEERRAQALEHERQEEIEREEATHTPVIMVTDDSVTVRKVTGRFLERQGYEVVTAKDGMDAVAQLEDWRPDLMLLDIEMPRMDGFEVATHMRHNERLKDVPIIMITSRTGEKHQDRAFDIGVNAYLGKPFQEQELLTTIRELLSKTDEPANQ